MKYDGVAISSLASAAGSGARARSTSKGVLTAGNQPGNSVYDNSLNTISGRRLRAFVAAFAGVFLLGGVVMGVEFFELHRKPVEATPAIRPSANEYPAAEYPALEAKLRASHARTADAFRQADATELAVFQFLNGRFVDSTEQAAEPPRPEPRRTPVGPTIRPNPEWIDLNRQLSAMKQHRSELLVKLTPEHPTVQALDSEISKAQDQLAATPAELPTDPNQAPSETPVPRETVSTLFAEVPPCTVPPSPEIQRNYRNLLLSAGRARDAYRTALANENADWNAFQHGGSPTIAMDRAGSIELRPSEAKAPSLGIGDRVFPIGAIAILTLLSLFAGALAARQIERQTLTFMSAEEIEATLGLPVLGRFGAGTDRRSEEAA